MLATPISFRSKLLGGMEVDYCKIANLPLNDITVGQSTGQVPDDLPS